jgi:CheY-like chemotaxis protein
MTSGNVKNTILVVEDEEDVRSFISRCMSKHGFIVLEAENGKKEIQTPL